MKRLFDIFLSLLGLFATLPLWLIFGLNIWLQDGGPVFYLQERVGKKGRIFKSIKFRSMLPQPAEERVKFMQAQEHDERITKVGSLLRAMALDELPQLINILKGEMSFVGPRALVPREKEINAATEKDIFNFPGFKERSQVRPGLTGIAQVFAPRDIGREDKFKYDIWYIENQSFLLDVYLIILSFWVSFKAKWETRGDKFNFLAKGLKSKIESQIRSL